MAEGYLGEFPVNLSATEFAPFNVADWAMYFIESYGWIDGDHHKTWVLDQVARLLKGTGVTVVEARWESGEKEYRVSVDDPPSSEYLAWVEEMRAGAGYDEGIPP